ncbi:MgtC/SapB family protein [Chthonobacter albigriseus]|uniref:MgtC/SapB family protein n=1 Tax=Chthonobacter albigriseus TaxID=1683161 RepID=UPI0015EFDA1F|nr:MgtC/SapB family protein [Chthonobacter albigriseus]
MSATESTMAVFAQDDLLQVLWRLLAALFAGAVLGFDREMKGHAAGLRTHMMVALAAAATSSLSLELYEELHSFNPNGNADPMRIIEGVIAAVGFLGGGMIIVAGGKVQGLTTAANLWACGIIGLAFGSGLFRIGFMTLGLAFLVLVVIGALERHLINKDRHPRKTPDEG